MKTLFCFILAACAMFCGCRKKVDYSSYEKFFTASCRGPLAQSLDSANSLFARPDGPAVSQIQVPSIDEYGKSSSSAALGIEKKTAQLLIPQLVIMGWFTSSRGWQSGDSLDIARKLEKILTPYEIQELNTADTDWVAEIRTYTTPSGSTGVDTSDFYKQLLSQGIKPPDTTVVPPWSKAHAFLLYRILKYRSDEEAAYSVFKKYLAQRASLPRRPSELDKLSRRFEEAHAAYQEKKGAMRTLPEFAYACAKILEWDCRHGMESSSRQSARK